MKIALIVVAVIVGIIVIVLALMWPELKRYMKIRRM
jgi:hypothetical protein